MGQHHVGWGISYVMRMKGELAIYLRGAWEIVSFPLQKEMKHFEPYPLGYFQIDWKRFGELVKLAREENKFSLRGMADFTGISAATLCRCERGESVEPDHFFTLLQVLGLPFEIPDEITKPA